MSTKLRIRLSFIIALLSWLSYSFFDIYFIILNRYEIKESFAELLPQAFLTLFVVSVVFYFRYVVTKAESVNFMELLWRVFITGLVTTTFSLIMRLVFNLFSGTSFTSNPITVNFFYHVFAGLVLVFLISTFVVWKRLILYQKTKSLIRFWNTYEYVLAGALIFDFFGYNSSSLTFTFSLLLLGSFAFVLSFNLKWIAYLNFKQKWKSILFILLSGIYLYHFFLNLNQYASTQVLTIDLLNRVFVVGILVFIIVYAAFSILVTLFNLPTSSEFERKLKEAVDFQKLSQTVPTGKSETDTYAILLDSSMSAVFADAAWLEIERSDGSKDRQLRNITNEEVIEIKRSLEKDDIHLVLDLQFSIFSNSNRFTVNFNTANFRSLLALPIFIQNRQLGSLVLLRDVSDAFNREMISITSTFVNQASVAIENARLLNEAIETERYKEQLDIAKQVQRSLLPTHMGNDPMMSITAFSAAAEEVGGDYYDYIQLDENLHGIIVGDVSGKGTSAAFQMAQLKGVFHSLARAKVKADQLMSEANDALSRCLDKSSFITATYIIIDTQQKKLSYTRAGHCPAIYYHASSRQIEMLDGKGMGLGIIKNPEYEKFVSEHAMAFESGDILLLYTDGVSEMSNQYKQLFGTQKLGDLVQKLAAEHPETIKNNILNEIDLFMEGLTPNDDYTFLLIKFNGKNI